MGGGRKREGAREDVEEFGEVEGWDAEANAVGLACVAENEVWHAKVFDGGSPVCMAPCDLVQDLGVVLRGGQLGVEEGGALERAVRGDDGGVVEAIGGKLEEDLRHDGYRCKGVEEEVSIGASRGVLWAKERDGGRAGGWLVEVKDDEVALLDGGQRGKGKRCGVFWDDDEGGDVEGIGGRWGGVARVGQSDYDARAWGPVLPAVW